MHFNVFFITFPHFLAFITLNTCAWFDCNSYFHRPFPFPRFFPIFNQHIETPFCSTFTTPSLPFTSYHWPLSSSYYHLLSSLFPCHHSFPSFVPPLHFIVYSLFTPSSSQSQEIHFFLAGMFQWSPAFFQIFTNRTSLVLPRGPQELDFHPTLSFLDTLDLNT